jgi:hypothetical protein
MFDCARNSELPDGEAAFSPSVQALVRFDFDDQLIAVAGCNKNDIRLNRGDFHLQFLYRKRSATIIVICRDIRIEATSMEITICYIQNRVLHGWPFLFPS